MKKTLIVLAATAMLGVPALAADMPVKAPPAPAWVNWILISNNQISLDYATTNLNYEELTPFPGCAVAVCDSEKGWVPGVSVTGATMRDFFGIHNVYLYSRITYVSGHTQYTAAGGAITSASDGAQMWDYDSRIGRGFEVGNNAMVTPYLGSGAHWWDRTNPGYQENYYHNYVGAGLLFQYSPAARLVLSANGLVGSTFNGQMALSNDPAVTPYTYKLGSFAIYMAGGSADYAVTEQWHVNAGVDYTAFQYGQSPANPANGSFEPNSRTSSVTVRAGIGYAFGGPATISTRY